MCIRDSRGPVLPVIGRGDTLGEPSQLRRRQRCGEHAQCAIQLSQRVRCRIPVRPVRERYGAVGIGMGTVSFSGEDEELITRFGDRGGIPVGGHAPEQLAGDHIEDGDGIVIGFCDQQTRAIGGKCDSIGCCLLYTSRCV